MTITNRQILNDYELNYNHNESHRVSIDCVDDAICLQYRSEFVNIRQGHSVVSKYSTEPSLPACLDAPPLAGNLLWDMLVWD